MKHLAGLFLVVLLSGCSSSNDELFRITDGFVSSLDTTYESYGILGGREHLQVTSDGRFQVVPLGRLINVKIMEVVDAEAYLELKSDLEDHYEGDSRVNDVYISNAGTIMIDCRN